jgi:hypothetical protein
VEKVCPMFEKCPLLPRLSEVQRKVLIENYCKGDFSKCARKKIKDSGKMPPADLMPDGTILK